MTVRYGPSYIHSPLKTIHRNFLKLFRPSICPEIFFPLLTTTAGTRQLPLLTTEPSKCLSFTVPSLSTPARVITTDALCGDQSSYLLSRQLYKRTKTPVPNNRSINEPKGITSFRYLVSFIIRIVEIRTTKPPRPDPLPPNEAVLLPRQLFPSSAFDQRARAMAGSWRDTATSDTSPAPRAECARTQPCSRLPYPSPS